MNRTKVVGIGLLTFAALTTGSIAAVAAIPSSSGLITGCRDTKVGALRVIDADAGQVCKTTEAKLTWNQTGAPGPVGPQGPKGDTGAQGPAGLSGLSGARLVEAWTSSGMMIVRCNAGETVLSGGFWLSDPTRQVTQASIPMSGSGSGKPDAWAVVVINNYSLGWTAYAVCVPSS